MTVTLTDRQRNLTLENTNRYDDRTEANIKVYRPHCVDASSGINGRSSGIHRAISCTLCSYRGGNITVHDPDVLHVQTQHIYTQHKWERFLLTAGLTPRMHFSWKKTTYGDACDRRITRPAFVLHMMGWHVGHFLIDTFEALYYAHQERFGRVNRDTLLFIDISERDGMQPFTTSIMARDAFDGDTPFKLLRSFTRHPILSKTALDRLPGTTCFDDLQAELDLSRVFTTRGLHRHPAVARPSQHAGDAMFARRYQDLALFARRRLTFIPSIRILQERTRVQN